MVSVRDADRPVVQICSTHGVVVRSHEYPSSLRLEWLAENSFQLTRIISSGNTTSSLDDPNSWKRAVVPKPVLVIVQPEKRPWICFLMLPLLTAALETSAADAAAICDCIQWSSCLSMTREEAILI